MKDIPINFIPKVQYYIFSVTVRAHTLKIKLFASFNITKSRLKLSNLLLISWDTTRGTSTITEFLILTKNLYSIK